MHPQSGYFRCARQLCCGMKYSHVRSTPCQWRNAPPLPLSMQELCVFSVVPRMGIANCELRIATSIAIAVEYRKLRCQAHRSPTFSGSGVSCPLYRNVAAMAYSPWPTCVTKFGANSRTSALHGHSGGILRFLHPVPNPNRIILKGFYELQRVCTFVNAFIGPLNVVRALSTRTCELDTRESFRAGCCVMHPPSQRSKRQPYLP